MLVLKPNKKVGAETLSNDAEYLEKLKAIKKEKFKSMCEEDILIGFTATNGHFYRTNRDDQLNMSGQKTELDDDLSITTVAWKTEDVGYIIHTREEWLNIYIQAFQHKKKTLEKYNTLKLQIRDAITETELAGITW